MGHQEIQYYYAPNTALSRLLLGELRTFQCGNQLRVAFRETDRFLGKCKSAEAVRLVSEAVAQPPKRPRLPSVVCARPRKRGSLKRPPPQHDLALVIKKRWLDLIL